MTELPPFDRPGLSPAHQPTPLTFAGHLTLAIRPYFCASFNPQVDMNQKKPPIILVSIILVLVLALGAVLLGYMQQEKERQAADRDKAEAKLQKQLEQRQWAAEQEEAARQWAQGIAAARQAEAEKPHYSPLRLEKAARSRSWAVVHVPDIGVQAVLNTLWRDGQIYYRVALLGQKNALELFTSEYRQFTVTFADQSGTKIFEIALSPTDFQMDPPTVNGGIPTMELNNSIDCDLPVYENSVQWNMLWAQ